MIDKSLSPSIFTATSIDYQSTCVFPIRLVNPTMPNLLLVLHWLVKIKTSVDDLVPVLILLIRICFSLSSSSMCLPHSDMFSFLPLKVKFCVNVKRGIV